MHKLSQDVRPLHTSEMRLALKGVYSLARQFKLCHDCMEMSDTPAHPMFHFFLRFEDESGWSMDVFVTSNQVWIDTA